MIYLDHAATSLPKPEGVAAAMTASLSQAGNGGRGSHGPALNALRQACDLRQKAAALFSVPGGAESVAFTGGATQALNTAICGLFSPGDHVITTAAEHNSVLRPLYRLEDQGMELTIVPADALGRMDYEEMERAVRPNTRGIVCTHASNVTGNLTDLGRVGEICRKHHLHFVVDGAQTAGTIPISMEEWGIDVLCLPGHKGLLGPQGIGLLCVRPGVEIRPLLVGGSGIRSFSRTQPEGMPDRLEAGTRNGPGIAGLNAALDFLLEQGVEEIGRREQELLRRLYENLSEVPGVRIYGDFSTFRRAPVLSFNLEGWDAGEVSDILYEEYGIATRPGAHCAPLMHQALSTGGAVRLSLGHATTEEEVDRAAEAIRALAEEG